MDSLLQAMNKAWGRIRDSVEKDPMERARRLARRRTEMMQRPPRAWCLAVRASDNRINPGTAICVPEDAAYPAELTGKAIVVSPHTNTRGKKLFDDSHYGRHEVTLTAKLVKKLTRPVYIPSPGLGWRDVAKELGCSAGSIRYSMEHGGYTVERYLHLNGASGRAVPRMFIRKQLDAGSSRRRQSDDPLWATTSVWLDSRVPEDLEQTIERVPDFRVMKVKRSFDKQNRRLNDQRTQKMFRGWKWICPGCGKTARTLFYPLPRVWAFQFLKHEPPPGEVDGMPEPVPGFACVRCHRVLYFTKTSAKFWNHLIAHVSGGMLYGHEVPSEGLFENERKRVFKRRIGRAPSKRREEVLERILKGSSYPRIAQDLGLKINGVWARASEIFKQHGVHTRAELLDKFGDAKVISPQPTWRPKRTRGAAA